jgi:hypothetical protein
MRGSDTERGGSPNDGKRQIVGETEFL